MNKGFIAGIILSISVLSGCSVINDAVNNKTPDLNKAFSCGVSIEKSYGEDAKPLEIGGTMTRYGTGIWEMNVTAPDTISGLKLSLNDDGVSAEIGGLSFDTPTDKINDGALFSLVFKAVDNCAAQPKLALEATADGSLYSGFSGDYGYTMLFDEATGELKQLDFDGLGVTAKFENMRDIAAESDITEAVPQ